MVTIKHGLGNEGKVVSSVILNHDLSNPIGKGRFIDDTTVEITPNQKFAVLKPTEMDEIRGDDAVMDDIVKNSLPLDDLGELTLVQRIERFRTYHDTDGNKVIFSRRKKFRRVDLWIPHSKYKPNRCIGRISQDKKGKVTYRVLKYMTDHHYRELDSFGFNDTVVHSVLHDDDTLVVRIKETGEVLETSVANLKEHGSYRRYKNNGLERQIFLDFRHFTHKK